MMKPVLTIFIITVCIFILKNSTHGDTQNPSSVRADYILVEKAQKRLTLYAQEKPIKTYEVALGRNPQGPKLAEGDKRTPEGRYIIDARNPDSKYHLSLHISYPNEIDQELTRIAGVSPGGDIMIHGTGEEFAWMGQFHDAVDWTDGCIAVTNEEIEEIWSLVPDGTVIEILP